MNIEFDVQLSDKDLFRFNMRQAYTGLQGWISVVFAVVVFALSIEGFRQGAYGSAAMYIVIGIFVLLYVPLELRRRAKRTFKKDEVISGKLHYSFSDKCILVRQGEESAELPWDSVYKVVSDKHQLLVYSSRINAYVIPRDQIAEQYDAIRELAVKVMPSHRVKLRG
ncbi:MAG: YcxB family protein [Clostridiales bacterium]|nr:YcxB family protein [Clostridiales bacterium]